MKKKVSFLLNQPYISYDPEMRKLKIGKSDA